MFSNWIIRFGLIIFWTLGCANLAGAGQAITHPCGADIAKLCPDVNKKKQDEVRECLAAASEKVSAGCLSFAKAKNSCFRDSEKLCKQANPFRVDWACLSDRKDLLSARCRLQYKKYDELASCRGDIDLHCPKGARWGFSASSCLLSAYSKLSQACKTTVSSTPCGKDWVKLCSSSKESPPECMAKNQQKLSEECKKIQAKKKALK